MSKFDVAGVGNAIVDVLSFIDEKFLIDNQLVKGSMTLVDSARSAELYAKLGQTAECSGGSVANSLAGLASLGARTAFVGKVAADQMGKIFTHDMRSIGVHFNTPPLDGDISTASCLVCVTPDAQRTMATYLGACTQVTEADIDEAVIADAKILYIEGYLWDAAAPKAAIRKAIAAAKKSGRKVAFTLSDTFCVDRFRDEFLRLIEHDIDILFANENELKSLYQTQDFDRACEQLQGACEVAAVTRSEKGSVVITEDAVTPVATSKVDKVVDTTGAGDLYAAGFLFGLAHGKKLAECAALGNRCAGHIITQLGARSMKPLNELVA